METEITSRPEDSGNLYLGDSQEKRPQSQENGINSIEVIKPSSYGISVTGRRRKHNEDAILDRPDIGLWAVADGMGGHKAGEVASGMIVSALDKVIVSEELDVFAKTVSKCLGNVNEALLDIAESDAEGQIIGSTVVALLAKGMRGVFLWAGDSRLYLFRNGLLRQMTADHSECLESRVIGEESGIADQRLQRNVITRAVGADEVLKLDRGQCEIEPGDVFLLASDGLDKEVDFEEIQETCRQIDDCKNLVATLIDMADQRGSRDNVSVIAVRFDG
jgi:type VI secretion system protein ImpM